MPADAPMTRWQRWKPFLLLLLGYAAAALCAAAGLLVYISPGDVGAQVVMVAFACVAGVLLGWSAVAAWLAGFASGGWRSACQVLVLFLALPGAVWMLGMAVVSMCELVIRLR